jgi:hypothetical protein
MKAFDVYIMDNFGERDGKDSLDRFYGVFFTILQYTINSKGWLDASIKLNSLEPLYKECDEILHLDAIYYAGIDKVDAHKTKNYEKMELIKEFQDEALIEEYFDSVFLHTFEAFITDKKIDAFLIVPNNVRRQISFNEYIAKHLAKLYPSYPQITVDTKMFA